MSDPDDARDWRLYVEDMLERLCYAYAPREGLAVERAVV